MAWKRRRGWHDGPGRVKEALARKLKAVGIEVDPWNLWCQEGGYRHRNWDLACWGSQSETAVYKGDRITLCSWDTMTNCIKRAGVVVGGWWCHKTLEINRAD